MPCLRSAGIEVESNGWSSIELSFGSSKQRSTTSLATCARDSAFLSVPLENEDLDCEDGVNQRKIAGALRAGSSLS